MSVVQKRGQGWKWRLGGGLGAWEAIHSRGNSWAPLGEKRKGPGIPEAPQCLEEEEAAKAKNKGRVGL